jgi:hypothetical protein
MIDDPSHLTTRVLTSMLSSAIAPVTLISGMAFLISIMATRYARCIDRIRVILKEIKSINGGVECKETQHLQRQIRILYARTKALRTTMTFAASSVFCVVLTIFGSFSSMMFEFPNALTVASIFLIALLLLVAAVSGFIRDILISLRAVKVEIQANQGGEDAK